MGAGHSSGLAFDICSPFPQRRFFSASRVSFGPRIAGFDSEIRRRFVMRLHIRNMLPFLLVALALCGGMAAQVGGPEARTPDLQVTSWTGRLVDADCMAAKPSEPWDAFARPPNFGLVTSTGAPSKLDSQDKQL